MGRRKFFRVDVYFQTAIVTLFLYRFFFILISINIKVLLIFRGWSGGAMVLGKLPVPGRPTLWITVGQGPTALVVGAGGGCLDIFTLIYPFLSSFSPSLWETARYRLKYCLEGPLNPKQPTNLLIFHTQFQPKMPSHSGENGDFNSFAIFSNGDHLEFSTRLNFTILKPRSVIMLHMKFKIHRCSGLRE